MIIQAPTQPFETDRAGTLIYPVDNGEPLSNDTEHLKWITFLKNGLEDWFGDRTDVFVAADLLWYPIEGRPDICKAPDVMVVLDHPAGERLSYKQWEEQHRMPDVVFEFISKSNTADEMMDKLDFYSDMGCREFFIYDYRRGKFSSFLRNGGVGLHKTPPAADGSWHSKLLDLTFGLDPAGRLWIRRPDGKLMETQRQISVRADAEAKRADTETKRADTAARRAELLAAKLRELGINPDLL
ncbi:MAG: Uma2 family endonuclease [Prosthecobacter sp.]|uniref:Uma2 family endonuclease n=1 Tax=Prosthecobacter sp. TaxID=1965333 RepID=UPI0039025947